jgi:hypothetical protein
MHDADELIANIIGNYKLADVLDGVFRSIRMTLGLLSQPSLLFRDDELRKLP